MVVPNCARRAPILLMLLLLAISQAACSTTRPSTSNGSGSSYQMESLSAILARPLSWDKLDALERWLDRNGPYASARDRNEARLALAEGRASDARQDLGTASAAVLVMRQDRARSDFQLVLADGGASSVQRARAQRGITLLGKSGTTTASASFGSRSAGTGLQVISRAAWGASPEVPRHMSRHQAPWNKITIHHSAMPLGRSSAQSARAGELRTIQRGHLNKPEGWGDIGYHYLIDPEGRIYEGRRLNWRGAHVGGQNDHNLGVCLLGNFESYRPTAAALTSLERLVDDLRSRNRIPRNQVTYHKEWPTANTACPGKYLAPWVQSYRGGGSGLAFHDSPASPSPRRTVRRGGGTVR